MLIQILTIIQFSVVCYPAKQTRDISWNLFRTDKLYFTSETALDAFQNIPQSPGILVTDGLRFRFFFRRKINEKKNNVSVIFVIFFTLF